MKFQVVGYILGILITVVGLAQMVPAIIDWRLGHPNGWVFLFNGILCLFFGGSLILANRSVDLQMSLRQGFLLTVLSWVVMSIFCALPLYMADLNLRYVDAFFEAVSGITTTGATVLNNLDTMSHGVLFWRSMMQWVGGLGVVVFAIVLLPYLKVGGMQVFLSESSGHSEKVMPRSTEIFGSLFKIYALLTGLCAATYFMFGMSWFDAINHAMTTISTGGFSTHDVSFGRFESAALQYSAVLFMLLGAMPYVLYVRMVFQRRFSFVRDEQVRSLVIAVVAMTAIMTSWLYFNSGYSLETSFRSVLFSVVSIITTTGYITVDYTFWGGFAVLTFLLMTYVGASAGSTAGGIKLMRLVIGAKVVARQFKTLLYPSGVFVLNYQGRRLDSYTVLTVLGFLSLYVVANAVMTIALALTGLDFETALSGAASSLANVGPGVGGTIGPSGHFAPLPDMSKWILCAGMILGRLEILTVLVLFTTAYWQR